MSVDFEPWSWETVTSGCCCARGVGRIRAFLRVRGRQLAPVAPEEADPDEVPGELRAFSEIRCRAALGIEPSAPGREAWAFTRQTMESIEQMLGGVCLDPAPGRDVFLGVASRPPLGGELRGLEP